MTDGFRYLSFSGNVAGKSLKSITDTGMLLISTSHGLRRSIDQFLTPNWLFHELYCTKLQHYIFDRRVGVRGHHENRHRCLRVLQLEQQIYSSLSRHPIVADDEIEVVHRQRF